MLNKKKYRLLAAEEIIPNTSGWNSTKTITAYRIQALRSIPVRGIKRGDLGGYVSSPDVLSHEGNCWVGYGASALGKVRIMDDAVLLEKSLALCDFKDSMIIISGSARISDNVRVTISKDEDDKEAPKIISRISGKVTLFDNAWVASVKEVSGNANIYGNAYLGFADKISGELTIRGHAVIGRGASVLGKSLVADNASIGDGATIKDCSVRLKAQIGKDQEILGGDYYEEGIFMSPPKEIPTFIIDGNGGSRVSLEKSLSNEAKDKTAKVWELFESILNGIASYEKDIVKIIKYPAMTDRTDVHTLKMTKLRNKAERLSVSPADPEFEEVVSDLEDAFLAAESNALKLSATMLSDADKKKTEKAKDLLAVASNEASTEHEKKVAFVQGFKQLEGVIAVPEEAIDAFRSKIGLAELEM